MSRVLFVRHGETTWNREGRIQGWASTPLTGRGRDQARATGVSLRSVGVDRVLASDLRRAQETARLMREGTRATGGHSAGGHSAGGHSTGGDGQDDGGQTGVDAAISFEQAWRERDFGDYQGADRAAIADRHEEFDPSESLVTVESVPGGESLEELCRRVVAGLESLLACADGETVAVVTHGGPLRAVVAEIEDRDVASVAREWSPDNCGITEVDVSSSPDVVRRDDTSHLE